MADTKYIFLRNRNKSIETIKEFMEREKVYSITEDAFFNDNRNLIFSQMTIDDKDNWAKTHSKGAWPVVGDLDKTMLLPCPCNLRIDRTKVTTELAISQTNFQTDSDSFVAFENEEIQKILQNEGYKVSGLSKINPTVQVFGWFKSLHFIGEGKPKDIDFVRRGAEEFSDLSKYIISLNTVSGKDGGSFSMTLPIINTSKLEHRRGVSSSIGVNSYGRAQKDEGDDSKSLFSGDDGFYHKSPLSQVESNYFNWLITSNDLLFISFEELDMDRIRKSKITDLDSFSIETNISGQTYDMICLVDEVRTVTDDSNAEAHVEITGRDLSKLLIEDGSFFFNMSTTKSGDSVFANEKQGDKNDINYVNGYFNNPMFRMRLDSTEVDIFRNKLKMDLDYILKGVISQLANIEVVPNSVLNSYGDKLTKFTDLKPVK